MSSFDIKSKKILHELGQDSRQTNKQIAKKVGLSEQVVGNRIKQLHEKEIIEYFYVKTNPSSLGFMHAKIYLRLHNVTKNKEDELIQSISKKKKVFWMASLRGKYDLVISIYIKNLGELTSTYNQLFEEWGEYILEKNIVLIEQAYTYTNNSIKEDNETIYITGKEEKKTIDELDKKIIRILSLQGRKKLIEIAKELNTSADTVHYRLKKLKEEKIITGFSTKINFSKINNTYNIIFMKTQQMNKKKNTKLRTISKANKNILIYIKTIGEHDKELEVISSKKDEIDQIIRILRDEFTIEIKNYEILEVTKEHVLNYYPF